jgi:hypothetical protein
VYVLTWYGTGVFDLCVSIDIVPGQIEVERTSRVYLTALQWHELLSAGSSTQYAKA